MENEVDRKAVIKRPREKRNEREIDRERGGARIEERRKREGEEGKER